MGCSIITSRLVSRWRYTLFMILRDGISGREGDVLNSVPWHHSKNSFYLEILHNEGTPTFGTQPKLTKLSKE